MRTARRLGAAPGFTLDAVVCRDDHRGWSSAEVSRGHSIVLARRGRFRRMAGGRAVLVDPTIGYVAGPGEEQLFAHPAGGDECTALGLSPPLWHTLAGEGIEPVGSTVYVDARLDLAHRLILEAGRDGDPAFGLSEALLPLVASALRRLTSAPTPASGGSSARRRSSSHAVVDAARQAILSGHPAAGGLMPLAKLLDVSPYQLSRAFTRELGVSVTRYRNRVRVHAALDRLEQGEDSLAGLAADLGFADQAHLTRTIRDHVGHTPAALRRLLTAGHA